MRSCLIRRTAVTDSVLLDLLHHGGDQDESHQTQEYAQRHQAPGPGIHALTLGARKWEPLACTHLSRIGLARRRYRGLCEHSGADGRPSRAGACT
jgi:hypothetical protein